MKKHRILYDPTLEIEKKEFFIGTKIGKQLSSIQEFFQNLPVGFRWFFTLLVSGIISSLVAIMVTVYFKIGFYTIEDINNFLRAQLIIDIVIVLLIIVFIVLVIKEARS